MSMPATDNRPSPATQKGQFSYTDLLARLVVVGLLLASVGLLWWSYCRVYAPRAKVTRDLNASVEKLTAEVETMDRRWTKAEMDAINDRFTLVQPRLFADQPELEGWLADFREQIAPLSLEIKTDLASPSPAPEAKLLSLPATMTITFRTTTEASGGPSPYQRLLQFAERITAQDKNADLTALTVDSGLNSIGRAVVGVNFWTNAKEAR